MGTTLEGKKPGGADATFRWLLHTGDATLASPRRVSTGDGLDTGLVVGAASIGVANAGGYVLTFDASALTAGRSVVWRDLAGTVALLDDIPETSAGGNGVADLGKVPIFDGDGFLVASGFAGEALVAIGSGSDQWQYTGTGISFQGAGISGNLLLPASGTGLLIVLPSASGTLALSSQTLNLAGNQTAAGNKTLSGQLQLTGQSATDANSAMTKGLGDARYARRPIVLDQDVSRTNDIVASDVAMASAGNHPEGLSVFGFNVAANECVSFEFILHTTDASSPRNQRYEFSLPAGYAGFMLGLHATGNTGTTASYSFGASDTVVNALSTATNGGMVHIRGTIQNGANAGTVVMRFRQQASSANTITIKKGSCLIVHRP
jgi:hypothetical protein